MPNPTDWLAEVSPTDENDLTDILNDFATESDWDDDEFIDFVAEVTALFEEQTR